MALHDVMRIGQLPVGGTKRNLLGEVSVAGGQPSTLAEVDPCGTRLHVEGVTWLEYVCGVALTKSHKRMEEGCPCFAPILVAP